MENPMRDDANNPPRPSPVSTPGSAHGPESGEQPYTERDERERAQRGDRRTGREETGKGFPDDSSVTDPSDPDGAGVDDQSRGRRDAPDRANDLTE
jgi:hypothetical protein